LIMEYEKAFARYKKRWPRSFSPAKTFPIAKDI
jgi:hypothetical protein